MDIKTMAIMAMAFEQSMQSAFDSNYKQIKNLSQSASFKRNGTQKNRGFTPKMGKQRKVRRR